MTFEEYLYEHKDELNNLKSAKDITNFGQEEIMRISSPMQDYMTFYIMYARFMIACANHVTIKVLPIYAATSDKKDSSDLVFVFFADDEKYPIMTYSNVDGHDIPTDKESLADYLYLELSPYFTRKYSNKDIILEFLNMTNVIFKEPQE